ncbi:alpha/beta fold hydrolase [Thiosocius teredinicola]|uniref:alpha/beta fold hydrolase n=1 Tax=Thiosocius teredinicola TaxID=1973002 RepID=UPI000990C202
MRSDDRSLTAQVDRVIRATSFSSPEIDYYLYRPSSHAQHRRILVSVHGVSRNAEEHIQLFRPLADRYGALLIAPLFTNRDFRDYQRLGRRKHGPRADLALIRVLNEVALHIGCDTSCVDFFGFSGGAQFVHRFAMAHGTRVRRMVLGAAGWYTMPDDSLAYPHGIANARGLDAVRLSAKSATRMPTLVLVGDQDDKNDDEELNLSEVVCRTQGNNRVERARAWQAAMNRYASRHGLMPKVDLDLLNGVGHSFSQAVHAGSLADRVFSHLYGELEVVSRRWSEASMNPEQQCQTVENVT